MEGVFPASDHHRRGELVVCISARKPRGCPGRNPTPNPFADGRNCCPRTHRQSITRSQGTRRSGQPCQEPLPDRYQPRIAFAFECGFGLHATAGKRSGHASESQRCPGSDSPQWWASGGFDWRLAGYLQDWSGPSGFTQRPGALVGADGPTGEHVSFAGGSERLGIWIPLQWPPTGICAYRWKTLAPDFNQSVIQRDQIHGTRQGQLHLALPQSGGRIQRAGHWRRHCTGRYRTHLPPLRACA